MSKDQPGKIEEGNLQKMAEEKYPATYESGGVWFDDNLYKVKREAYIAGMQANEGLREAQAEYIEFLGKAYNRIYPMAHVHGYRESQEDIDKGLKMRERIKELSNLKQDGNEKK